MSDITMCRNISCPSRNTCYRFTKTPSERQYYSNFKPEYPGKNKCEFYWKDKRLVKDGKN